VGEGALRDDDAAGWGESGIRGFSAAGGGKRSAGEECVGVKLSTARLAGQAQVSGADEGRAFGGRYDDGIRRGDSDLPGGVAEGRLGLRVRIGRCGGGWSMRGVAGG